MNNTTIKTNASSKEYQNFKKEIDDLAVKNNLSWDKSLEAKKSMGKAGIMLAPFAIFLLILARVFSIFKISGSNNIIIPLLIAVFAIWIWYQAYKLLIRPKNIISPWAMGWVENALETKKAEKINKSKIYINLWLGIFFTFFGLMAILVQTADLMGKIITSAIGLMFIFLGLLGVINFKSWKNPKIVFYFLDKNKQINILIFIFISLICLGFVISPIIYYFSI